MWLFLNLGVFLWFFSNECLKFGLSIECLLFTLKLESENVICFISLWKVTRKTEEKGELKECVHIHAKRVPFVNHGN